MTTLSAIPDLDRLGSGHGCALLLEPLPSQASRGEVGCARSHPVYRQHRSGPFPDPEHYLLTSLQHLSKGRTWDKFPSCGGTCIFPGRFWRRDCGTKPMIATGRLWLQPSKESFSLTQMATDQIAVQSCAIQKIPVLLISVCLSFCHGACQAETRQTRWSLKPLCAPSCAVIDAGGHILDYR